MSETNAPCPVRQALADLVSSLGPEKVVFRHASGEPITTGQMVELLDNNDPIAADFVRDVYATALSLVRARATSPKAKESS